MTIAPRSTQLSLALLTAALASVPAAARVGIGDDAPTPSSGAFAGVARHVLPAVDRARLLAEDDEREGLELPLRVAVPVATDLTPLDSGTWEERAAGERVWRLVIVGEQARFLALSFDRLRLEPGASLRIYDRDGRPVLGPYAASGDRAGVPTWLPPVEGDSLTVELTWPARLRTRLPELRIAAVSQGYRAAWGAEHSGEEAPTDWSGACNLDVNCPAGDPWHDAKRGVVQLLIAGTRVCTGTLVNTTAMDCRPYVLTAAHCLKTQADASATLFRFAYERSLCESGSAPTDRVLAGATLRATYAASDATLLELHEAPPLEFEPYFNGWDRAATAAAETACIHHPTGAPKKISRDLDPPASGGPGGWGASHWRVVDWEDGTTEPGSSGAPLLDASGRIVGQLHGGTATCVDRTWDEFGKLSVSWSGGGTPASRLADWLDPLGTGATTLDGLDGRICARRLDDRTSDVRSLTKARATRTARRGAPR